MKEKSSSEEEIINSDKKSDDEPARKLLTKRGDKAGSNRPAVGQVWFGSDGNSEGLQTLELCHVAPK